MIKALRQRLDFIGPFDWAIMGILIGLFIGAVFGSRAAHAASVGVDWFSWWDGFLQNSGTEMLGAFLTFILLELVRGNRSKQEQIEAEKRRLILQMGSPDNAFAQEAVRMLRAEGWLTDGSLKKADLREANLEGANLQEANLEGANLQNANLKGANLLATNLGGTDLERANLEGTRLTHTTLQRAHLTSANLKGAVLLFVNLEEANLSGANLKRTRLPETNLEGADLRLARLEDADLRGTKLERVNFENATLPDGTKLPGRTFFEHRRGDPEPDWRTPFEAWDKAGRPRIEPTADEPEPENDNESN